MSITTPLAPPPADCPGGDSGFAAALTQVHAGLDRLADAAAWSLDDTGVETCLDQALRARARLDEAITRLIGQVEDRVLAPAAGASSTRAYLVATHRLTSAAAAAIVTAARGMGARCETTRAAWAAGDLTTDQATVIAAAVNRLGADVDADAVTFGQTQLIDQASRLTHPELQQLANHLVEVVDPDGADQILAAQLEADEHRARQTTMFRGRKGADGTARFSGRIPNLHYDLLTRALHAYTAPRRAGASGNLPTTSDGSDGVLGRVDAGTDPATQPYPQRLGQAFCELLEHLPGTELPQHGVANATIVITLDEHQLRTGLGEAVLDTSQTISVSEARRLACNAHLIPAVLDSPSHLLDLGASRRLYNRHQRLALTIRDQGCVFPRLRPAPRLDRSPPPGRLVRRRPHRPRQRLPAVPLPPPPHPPQRLDPHPGTRRHHRSHPTATPRPRTTTPPPPPLPTPTPVTQFQTLEG